MSDLESAALKDDFRFDELKWLHVASNKQAQAEPPGLASDRLVLYGIVSCWPTVNALETERPFALAISCGRASP